MKKYTYKFSDGTKQVVAVTDELYDVLTEMDREEYNGWQRENRRHVSMEELKDNGLEIADAEADLFRIFAKRERNEKLGNALSLFTREQQELICKVHVDKIPQTVLSEQMGITPRALNNRVKRILVRLKKLL